MHEEGHNLGCPKHAACTFAKGQGTHNAAVRLIHPPAEEWRRVHRLSVRPVDVKMHRFD
jgi:hypothetical protein